MLCGRRQDACTAFPFLLSLAGRVTCHRRQSLEAEDSRMSSKGLAVSA